VLQEKQFTSVGGHLIKSSDVRIIAATNVDLGEAIREGRFRMDLFYRLNVLPVVMPTLSERREDIPALLANFLDIANRMNPHKDSCFLTDEVVDVLCHYEWPGNIRELQNLVERLVVTSHGGEITTDDLPAEYRALAPLAVGPKAQRSSVSLPVAIGPSKAGPSIPASFGELPVQGIDLSNYIATIENNLINQALARTSNNKNQAAKLLGLNRTTLVERLKKRKIAGESPDDSDNKDA
jgi:DNA-binding NtrC family response regulator